MAAVVSPVDQEYTVDEVIVLAERLAVKTVTSSGQTLYVFTVFPSAVIFTTGVGFIVTTTSSVSGQLPSASLTVKVYVFVMGVLVMPVGDTTGEATLVAESQSDGDHSNCAPPLPLSENV